jgi:hypothetical protein
LHSQPVIWAGSVYLAAVLLLVISRTPLGSPLFFGAAVVMAGAYVAALRHLRNDGNGGNDEGMSDGRGIDRRSLILVFGFAVAFRAPLALSPVGADSDMVRYIWDGRVQKLGYNPYVVVPSDPAIAFAHTVETARMPSLRARTPYPPGAQVFFRAVVSVSESPLAMKLALVGCDLLTILLLWRWLVITGKHEWLVVTYAWNPLVVLEVAHSGHIDALGALWIAASAFWLSRRRTALASIAFVLAVATKFLPIVLAPLYVRRVRLRDAALAATLFAVLYGQFTQAGVLPLGALPNVVAHIRFNGPLFYGLAALLSAPGAAAAAVILGLIVAAVARWKLPADDPAAWAWPMAAALVCAPVIYPWYLLSLTPFLFTRATLPLTAWTFTVLSTYAVWALARHGGRWMVPGSVAALELGVPFCLGLAALWRIRRARPAHSRAGASISDEA